MKSIAHILFLSFFILTICPTMQLMGCNKKAECKVECTDTETKGSCEKESADCCPINMCNSCQCCFCCFVCLVENEKIKIQVYQTNIKNNSSADQFILSDFSADCWHPPKTV